MNDVSGYRLISFDLDGTLVDSAGEIAEAANRTLEDVGLARQPVEVVTRLIGAGTRELMLGLLRQLPGTGGALVDGIDRDAALSRFSQHYAATAGTSCRLYPHVRETLDALRHAGLRLACVTNKEERFSRSVLRGCGLDGAFELLVGGDTLHVRKPDARVLLHVVETLGATPSTTAHVGDSRIDVEAARNAGVTAWVVPYGYNGGEPVALANPDRVFGDFGELADLLLANR